MSLSEELQRLSELRDRGVLSPDEFERAKARVLSGGGGGGSTDAGGPDLSPISRLQRSRSDRWIGGVCGGLARVLAVDSWVVRLCFAILFLVWGTGLLLYLLLWLFVPEGDEAT